MCTLQRKNGLRRLQVIDYKGYTISAGSITTGKLGAKSKEQTSDTIALQMEPADALGTLL
jgi:hypothetical protein